MKTIPLKTLTDETPGQPAMEFSYSKVLVQTLTGAPAQGMTIEEMRTRMRIADALEAAEVYTVGHVNQATREVSEGSTARGGGFAASELEPTPSSADSVLAA